MSHEIVFSYAGIYRDDLPVPYHSHRGTELVYISQGECVTEFSSGEKLRAGKGMIYVTPPGVWHIQKNLTPDLETLYTVMEMPEPEFNLRLRVISMGNDSLMETWFRQLLELNHDYAQEQASALLRVIWLRLSEKERCELEHPHIHEGVRKALYFLEKNYWKPFSISDLAANAGISQSHLNACFRAEFGKSAGAKLLEIRMLHARQLLLNPYLGEKEISEMCGFSELNYFIRCFRSFHGVTPGGYRRDPVNGADLIRESSENSRSCKSLFFQKIHREFGA